MNIRTYAIMIVSTLCMMSNITQAETGKCHKAKDVIIEKSWEAIKYKYSPQYIEDNKVELEKAINGGSEVFFNDCQSQNLSDEQIILQGVLDFAALPIKIVADDFLKKAGFPPLGDKAFHIDVKAIDEKGIWGGKDSFFRKPFG